MALANMAKRLTEFNKKVCILDFDLEAPGLVHKFATNLKNNKISNGIVDYIHEYYVNGRLPDTIKEYSTNFNVYANKPNVDIIPAGNINATDYWKKLTAINWYDLLYDNKDGLAFFLDLKEKIRLEFNPDFLLIDSRTGITEISGITLAILADEVVVMAANNKENLEGSEKIIKSITNKENALLGKTPKITFVLSRIPFTDIPDERAKEQFLKLRIRDQFAKAQIDKFIGDNMCFIHSDRSLEEDEQLKIGYDKEKSTPQISKDYLILFEKITEDTLTEVEIQKFNELRLAEKLFERAVEEDQIDKKIEYLDEAIKLNPENGNYYLYRAEQNFYRKEFQKATEDCFMILKINQDDLLAYNLLGCVYLRQKNYKESLFMFEKAWQIDPKNAVICNNIGVLYEKCMDFDNSLKYASMAISIDPAYSLAYNSRAIVFMFNKNYEKAFDEIYKAIELDPHNPILYLTLAEIKASIDNENEFYFNLDTGLKLAHENKKNGLEIGGMEDLKETIVNEDIYKKFYKQERFQRLLEKYNINLKDENKI